MHMTVMRSSDFAPYQLYFNLPYTLDKLFKVKAFIYVLSFILAPRDFSLGTPVFPSTQKPTLNLNYISMEMKLNQNFLGGEGVQNKVSSVRKGGGGYGYFLELHIAYYTVGQQQCTIEIKVIDKIINKSYSHMLLP